MTVATAEIKLIMTLFFASNSCRDPRDNTRSVAYFTNTMAYSLAVELSSLFTLEREQAPEGEAPERRKRQRVPFFLWLLLMFHTRNRNEQPTLKARIFCTVKVWRL